MKQQELLAKGHATKEERKVISSVDAGLIKGDGRRGVDDHGHGDGGMLKVVEVVGWNGAIYIKRMVPHRANEELHGYGDGAAYHDKKEL